MVPHLLTGGSPKLNGTTMTVGGNTVASSPGVVYYWGEKYNSKPTFSANIPNIVSISCGFTHTLALTETGEVYSFGDNRNQQLGLSNDAILEQYNANDKEKQGGHSPSTKSSSPFSHCSIPLLISSAFNGLKVRMVAAGGCSSAAVLENGLLYTWGTLDDVIGKSLIIPTKVDLVKGVTSVSIGLNHMAVVAETNTPEKKAVFTWGNNKKGQLGVMGDSVTNAPRKVTLGARALSVVCGDDFTAAIVEGNEVFVWGNNKSRQICPNNTDDTISIPVKPFLGRDVVELACSRNFIVARTGAGNLYVWGNNEAVCRIADSSTMITFPGRIKQVSVGLSHVLALSDRGEVYSWGSGEDGQLGHDEKKSSQTFKKITSLEGRQVLFVVAFNRCSGAIVDPGNFKVDIAETMRRPENKKSPAPLFIRKLINHIRGDNSKLEGIFRLSGSKARVDELEKKLDSNDTFPMSKYYEVFDAADLLKRYFKSLPEPLLGLGLCSKLEKEVLNCTDSVQQKKMIMEWISQLPRENRDLLIYLLSFLDEVVDVQLKHQKGNAMSAKNLALVFAPNLLTRGEIGNDDIIEVMINMFDEIITAYPTLESRIIVDQIQDGLKHAKKIPYTIDLWQRMMVRRETARHAFFEPNVLIAILDEVVESISEVQHTSSPNSIINSKSSSSLSILSPNTSPTSQISPLQSPKHRASTISTTTPRGNNPTIFGSLSSPSLTSGLSNSQLVQSISSCSSEILRDFEDILQLFLSPIIPVKSILKVLPSLTQINDVNNIFIQLLLSNKHVKTINYNLTEKITEQMNKIKGIDTLSSYNESIVDICTTFITLTNDILMIDSSFDHWKKSSSISKLYLTQILEYFKWWNTHLQKSSNDTEEKMMRLKKDFDKVENEKAKIEKQLASKQPSSSQSVLGIDETTLKSNYDRWCLNNQLVSVKDRIDSLGQQMATIENDKHHYQIANDRFKPHMTTVQDFVDNGIKALDHHLNHLSQQQQTASPLFSQYCSSLFDILFKFIIQSKDNTTLTKSIGESLNSLSKQWTNHPHHLISLEIETKLNSLKKSF